ncbi:MAG: GntR family transcriptional regulator [Bowdeniella nasicola]|nr:GntR family transcriptional regulator [Bowdeniella nasicola]
MTTSRRETRTVQAYQAILDRLMRLVYPPGVCLTEAEVASDLQMTKTPVREALLMASADQLVIARPGAGYQVTPITLRTIRDLCAYWQLLESAAVRAACAKGLTEFDAIALAEALAVDSDDPFRAHTGAHHLIFDHAGEFYLWREWQRIQVELERLLRFALPSEATDLLSQRTEALFTNVLRADVTAAITELDGHIADLQAALIDGLLSSDTRLPPSLSRGDISGGDRP